MVLTLTVAAFNPRTGENIMAGVRKFRGKTKFVYLPMTESLALAKDSLVEMTSGKVAAADSSEEGAEVRGVLRHTIASTDSDYAAARLVEVEVPVERHVVWEFYDQTGFTASDIGIEYGLTSSTALDQTNTTNDVFLVTEVLGTGTTQRIRGFLKTNGSY